MKITIKIGGSLFDNNLCYLYNDIFELKKQGHQVIIVHGGGPQINDILEKMGKETRYIVSASGMKSRYTDEDTRDAAIMALAGIVNKKMVAALIKAGVDAFGFTGVDGMTLPATRKEKIISIDPATSKRVVIRDDMSGKIDLDKVNTKAINMLVDAGFTPVIGALAIDAEGNVLNTDGDRAAASICQATGGDVLVSVTDVPGVLKSLETNEVIRDIPASNLQAVMDKVKGGMKKKIFAVKEAIDMGIPKFIITSGLIEHGLSRALSGEIGTTITQ